MSDTSLSFTPLDSLYCGESAPLYIFAKLNGQIVMGVIIDPSCRVDVIMEETLFMNSCHRPTYDECQETLRMHDGFFVPPLGSITLMVLGLKAMSSTFVSIPESELFWVKLGIPWLIAMDVVPSVTHKCLKFPHKGLVHVIQDTGYRPLIARGYFSLNHLWPNLLGPILPCGDLMYHAYYQYKIG